MHALLRSPPPPHHPWETLWRAAPDDERDFFQGLIQLAAGLLHLQRRNRRGARNKLSEGVAKLKPFQPAHHGIFVNELIGRADGSWRTSTPACCPTSSRR